MNTTQNAAVRRTPVHFLCCSVLLAASILFSGCTTPAPDQKHYAAIWAVASDGSTGRWVTQSQSLQALDQSFTKVLLRKGYSVCPIVNNQTGDSLAAKTTPEAFAQQAANLGRATKVEYMFLAVLNQASTAGNGGEIHLNIISKMIKLGDDYAHDEILETHEWPEGGKIKTVPGGGQAVIEAIQKAAEAVASKYPNLTDLLKANR